MSASVQRKLQQAHQRLQSGDRVSAASLCEDVLERAPHNPDALWLLGTIYLVSGRPQDAMPLFEKALAAAPGDGATLESLGVAHLLLGQYAAAEDVLRKALSIRGAPPSVHMRLGIALMNQGEHGDAVTHLERAVALEPGNVDAHLNLGQGYASAGDFAAASREFEHVRALDPHHGDALYNLGVTALEQGQRERARSHFEHLLAQSPSYIDARERLVTMHLSAGRFREAIAHLREIVRLQPDNARTFVRLAGALLECGTLDEAASAAQRARELDPAEAGAYGTLAQIHYLRGELDQARTVLEEGYERTTSNGLLGMLVHLLHRMCDWNKWRPLWGRMAAELNRSPDLGSPYWLLFEDTTPQQQLDYTRRWAGDRFGNLPAAQASATRRKSERLRVGYLSADFYEHPVARLIVEILELHDRSRFEIFAYSHGPDDGSAMRARLRAAVDHFTDIAYDPDDRALELIHSHELDLLIDLRGYTMGDRLQIMAQRPCPVQVTWLGYPGGTGAGFIDYLIADDFIIPRGAESAYSERVLRMPHCYQPNDRKRPVAAPLTRAEYGLPETGCVFCSFNQTVKITPEVFGRWMSLLRRVPGSVLWLLEDNRWATANLITAAGEQDVSPERIVIAPRLPMAEHLARYRVADVALDTFPYGSHTTGSDALWSGCPLVALCGSTFAARVSGSLLTSCGLPELIAKSFEQYEEIAYRLSTDAALMRDVRARLARARDTAPLFDSVNFTRDLEQLYLQIAQR